jgi:hypothetical protein
VFHVVTTLLQVATVAYRGIVAGHHSSGHYLHMSFSPVQSECSSHGMCILPKHHVLFACPSDLHSHVRDQIGAHSPRLERNFLHVNISDIADYYFHCSSVKNRIFHPTKLSWTIIRLSQKNLFIVVY